MENMENEAMVQTAEKALDVVEPVAEVVADNRKVGLGVGVGILVGIGVVTIANKVIKPCVAKLKAKRAASRKAKAKEDGTEPVVIDVEPEENED